MNAVVPHQPASLNYSDLEKLAASIAQSGLFGIKTKDQAIVLMMIAHAEGRHPALAARDYDIINGRPAKKAEAMMREFIEAGGKVEWHALSDEKADATFTHPKTGSVRIDWDMKRAVTAFGSKDMYKKFPRQMLRSRVVSEGVRTLWPLATSGMYVPEEVGDIPTDTHTGPTVEHEADRVTATSRRDEINAEVPVRQPPRRSANAEDGDRLAEAERRRAAATAEQVQKPPRTRKDYLDGLEIALKDAVKMPDAAEAVDRIICGDEVMRAKSEFRNGHLERLNQIIFDALRAVTPQEPENAPENDPANHPDGGPRVPGEEKVMAG